MRRYLTPLALFRTSPMCPSEVLFQGKHQPVSLPVCDHYAGSEKLMRKSLMLQQQLGPVFDISFDCEDGAAVGNELEQAQRIAALIASADNHHHRVGVRIHDPSSPFFEQDVQIICGAAAKVLAYVVIPKAESLHQLKSAIGVVRQYAEAAGRNDLPIHVVIETHGALHDAWGIAALPEVECLSFGIMDFVSAHYGAIPGTAMKSPGQFHHPLVIRAKLEIAAACHAYGKIPSHNVCTEIRDLTVVASDAHEASRTLGYGRMWSIHPDQIKPIIKAFTPAAEETEDATSILMAAKAADWGPIQYKAKLHDRASYRYYWTVLQRARRSGQPLPETAGALM
jgi:citrate lyase subunit beta/citryl-CoA lyase